MKRLLLPLFFFFSAAAFAQTEGKASIAPQGSLKEGKVIYEHTVQMRIRFSGNMPEGAPKLPESRTDQYELLFGNNQALWKMLPNAAEEANTFTEGGGGNRVMFGRFGADEVVHYNFETGKRTAQKELSARNYIVEDSMAKLAWKLTDETKSILGYVARKATATNYSTRMVMNMENGEMKRREMPDTSTVVAWFTTQIPVPAGPEYSGQLPGLILELDVNNGRSVYKALEVSPKVSLASIKEPKGGKRVSATEFNKERDKMMEEMRQRFSGGGQIRIQTQ